MKILIVSEMSVPYAVGGGEVRYALLARELVQRGHEVTWLSMRQKGSRDEEVIDRVRHLHRGPRIEQPPQRPLRAMVRFMFTAFFHILTHRYDIIDTQTYAPLPPVWLACLLSRQKMVATIHDTSAPPCVDGLDDQWLSARDRWIVKPIEKLLYRLPYRRIVTVSNAVADDLVKRFGVSPARISVVPNGVDLAAIDAAPVSDKRVDLLFVGRIIPHKHVEDFLELVARIGAGRTTAGGPPIAAAVVGGGPLLEHMRQTAEKIGVAALVEFTGDLPVHADVISRMKAAMVLVLPSTREGFGLVLAEALAAGTAVVAYDIPPVRETVGPELARNLAECRDVTGLYCIVSECLEKTDSRQSSALMGQQYVRVNLSVDRFTETMMAVYRGF
ncbi:MAG: glycosyltransferase family 4 protein [Planctomycetes bacterium]|nr:glycosyltransferase family 4 protein [Planctomycetota bacterium]